MNTRKLRVLAAFSLVAVFASVDAKAQEFCHVKIPFSFTAGTHSLAAGNYQVGELTQNVLQIRSADNRTNVMVLVTGNEPGKIPNHVTLTFQRYGDEYFLSRVSNYDRGWGLPLSKREKELIANRALPQRLDVIASSGK